MKILVATDGSAHSLRALSYAVKLAGTMQPPPAITLINVHDETALRHARKFAGDKVVEDYLRELSDSDLKEAEALMASSGLTYEVEARTGHVSQAIIDYAKAGEFDLVILGAKGRSVVADLLVGSVAQRVLSGCTAPVLLVK